MTAHRAGETWCQTGRSPISTRKKWGTFRLSRFSQMISNAGLRRRVVEGAGPRRTAGPVRADDNARGHSLRADSASSRGGTPSEKKRLPVPNRIGKTSSKTSSASPCSSSTGVSVELPQTIRSGPSFAWIRRTPSTMSGPRSWAVPHSRLSGLWAVTHFVAAFRMSAIGLFAPFGQKPLKIP